MKCFLSSDCPGEDVKEADEKLLKHLKNVEADKTEDGKNLTVIFHFS